MRAFLAGAPGHPCMYEVELKVRADHATVRDRLEAIDATRIGTVRQVDTYFDAPDRNFANTDEALRIRQESESGETDPTVAITYKGPLVDDESKTREEAETRVADGDAIHAILTGLGYEPAATVSKERTRYSVDGCTVTLDRVEGLGEFVEVEVETERDLEAGDAAADDALENLRGDAEAVLERLGLDPADGIRTSYLGLLLADG